MSAVCNAILTEPVHAKCYRKYHTGNDDNGSDGIGGGGSDDGGTTTTEAYFHQGLVSVE